MFVRKLLRDDWKSYRALRLEALRLCPSVFTSTYDKEAAFIDGEWVERMESDDHAYFGLFDNDDMVGLTGIFKDRSDTGAKTAVMVASYIRAEYRGQNLSRLLYQARIDWAKAQGTYDRIVVGHRDGNEASRRANQAFGFTFTHAEDHVFGDGKTATIQNYEMRL